MFETQTQPSATTRRRIRNDGGAPIDQLVRNSKGEVMKLTAKEAAVSKYLQRLVNDVPLGYNISITTLTTIIKKVSEQKFFTIAPSDFIPLKVGEGAWGDQLITYTSFLLGGDFEAGLINTGADNSRLASADAGLTPVTVPIKNWAKQIGWSLFDLNQAQKAGNWDIVTSKEAARKKNWDLGIQKVAFLGLTGGGASGLLTQANASINTSLITKPISSMNPTELSAFLASLLQLYRANTNYTAYPTHFLIPEDDYNGLAIPTSPTYPLKSMAALISETLKTLTMSPNFKIMPMPYAIAANSSGLLSHARYALYNSDESSINMHIPVDYNSTLASSVNGFHFQNVGYGQFSGVGLYRPLELMYFDNLNA